VPTPFDIAATREGSRVVLSVSGELDLATVPRMQEHVEAALRLGADPLVADVRELTFIDSTASGSCWRPTIGRRAKGVDSWW
jgi:anti-anti-sigma factor